MKDMKLNVQQIKMISQYQFPTKIFIRLKSQASLKPQLLNLKIKQQYAQVTYKFENNNLKARLPLCQQGQLDFSPDKHFCRLKTVSITSDLARISYCRKNLIIWFFTKDSVLYENMVYIDLSVKWSPLKYCVHIFLCWEV